MTCIIKDLNKQYVLMVRLILIHKILLSMFLKLLHIEKSILRSMLHAHLIVTVRVLHLAKNLPTCLSLARLATWLHSAYKASRESTAQS